MSRPSLLYVDDDPDLRAIVALALDGEYDVTTASSAPEALAAVSGTSPPDAILSDLRMPGMDGAALLARLRSGGCEVPVVFLTARGDAPLEGAAGVLSKPFDPFALGSDLARLLARG